MYAQANARGSTTQLRRAASGMTVTTPCHRHCRCRCSSRCSTHCHTHSRTPVHVSASTLARAYAYSHACARAHARTREEVNGGRIGRADLAARATPVIIPMRYRFIDLPSMTGGVPPGHAAHDPDNFWGGASMRAIALANARCDASPRWRHVSNASVIVYDSLCSRM